MTRRPFLPSDVGRLTMRAWSFPQHLQALQAAVMRLMTDPECNRLLVEMPVRHGKSFYCSWAFVTWYLLTRPGRNVIITTYGKSFSGEWSRRVQNTVRDYGERLTGVKLGRTQREDFTDFAVTDGKGGGGGTLRTASPGTAVAGKGAHLLVLDDLVRDVREAVSHSRRDSLDRWVNSELLTRLEPGGKVLAVMSRRHPDDQSGRFLSQNGELPPDQQWHRITFPAIDDEGKALWPERWPIGKLMEEKARYELAGMPWLFHCLYQQDPRGDASILEWPESYFDGIGYDVMPPSLPVRFRVLALDPSKGRSDRPGDYSSLPDTVLDRDGTLWVDPWLRVLPAEHVEDEVVGRLQRQHYDAVIVESNGFQGLIADNIVKKCAAKDIRCPMFTKDSTENKEVRIRLGLGPLLGQKRIRMRMASSSYRLALQQLKEFPSASHDDFPDSLNLTCDLLDYLLIGREGGEGVTAYRA